MNRVITFAAGFVLIWIIGYFLIAGRGLLIPLFMAIFIWHLLNTTYNAMQRMPVVGPSLPHSLTMLLSLGVVVGSVWVLFNIISTNVNGVIVASSRYHENFIRILEQLDGRFHTETLTAFNGMLSNLSLQRILINISGVFTSLASSAVLIALYVVFLFFEQHYFRQKINALFPQTVHRELVNSIMSQIAKDTQTYLGLKTLFSLVTAVASWMLMKAVELDFAAFWALLIFFLNYIPNIGPIIATALPAVLALVQFQSWWPFVIITTGITLMQSLIGNWIEPRFLGKSLNLSPLVILLSLGLWGAVWGVLGMFLSVPIMVMLMIVFSHFDATRPIAILLSQNGNVRQAQYDANGSAPRVLKQVGYKISDF